MRAKQRMRVASGIGMVLTVICLATLAGCQDSSGPSKPAAAISAGPSAEAILTKMVEVYQSATSYADSGELNFRAIIGGQERPATPVPFSVTLVRPNKLRLHAYNTSIVCDGEKFWAANQDIPGQVVALAAPKQLSPADLTNDKILHASLRSNLDLAPVQLDLLLSDDPLATLTAPSGKARRLDDEKLGEFSCHRVAVPADKGEIVYWIDAKTSILRRVEFNLPRLRPLVDPEGRAASVEVWADFSGARLNEKTGEHAFEFDAPRGVALQTRFLSPPPDALPPLLGQAPGEFAFVDMNGAQVDPSSLAGKVVVLDMWSMTCEYCFRSLPVLDKLRQEFKDDPRVVLLAVSTDGSEVADATLAERFQSAGLGLPIVRDLARHADSLFQVRVLPTTIVLGTDGRVQLFETDYRAVVAGDVKESIKQLLAGEDLAKKQLETYELKRNAYERERAEALVTVSTEVSLPKAQIAAASQPRAHSMEQLWKADVPQPGNLIVVEAEGGARIYLCSGDRAVVELDAVTGKVLARHELELATDEAVTYLRTAVDSQGQRFFALFASGQQQFHVYDESWHKRLSYPPADLGRHAGIGDVQLADLAGDGELDACVGYWGQVGVQMVALDGRRQWSNRSLDFVLRMAVVGPDASGRRQLLCSNGRGTLIPLDHVGTASTEIAVANRQLHTVIAGMADGSAGDGAVADLCCLASSDERTTVALGVARDGTERWRYPLPPGVHTRPVELVRPGRFRAEGGYQWLLAGADGSVHVVARDGKLVDRFNTGKTLTGLAAAGIDGRSVLLVAGGDGLVAWSVAPK